jgi:hypothetical protein
MSCRGDFGQRNWCSLLRCQGWLLITIVDFVRPAVAERGVPASAVVEALDVADDVASGLGFMLNDDRTRPSECRGVGTT